MLPRISGAATLLHKADVECQIAWYKAQGLIDKGVNARDVVYLNFVK